MYFSAMGFLPFSSKTSKMQKSANSAKICHFLDFWSGFATVDFGRLTPKIFGVSGKNFLAYRRIHAISWRKRNVQFGYITAYGVSETLA